MSRFFIVFFPLLGAYAQTDINILVLTENESKGVPQQMSDAIRDAEKQMQGRAKLNMETVSLIRDDEEGAFNLCRLKKGSSLVIDLTWSGWFQSKEVCEKFDLPYVRGDVTIRPFIKAVDDFLTERNGTDSALIFQNEEELDQALYYMIGNSIIRIIVLDQLSKENVEGLYSMRPTPSFHSIFGSTDNVNKMFQAAYEGRIVQRHGRWNLVCMDFKKQFEFKENITVNLFTPQTDICCGLVDLPNGCKCPDNFQIVPSFIRHFGLLLFDVFTDTGDKLSSKSIDCQNPQSADNSSRNLFYDLVKRRINERAVLGYNENDNMVYYKMAMDINIGNVTQTKFFATWNTEAGVQLNEGNVFEEDRRFFRIGVIDNDEPWSYIVTDKKTGEQTWTGYCIDLAKKLATDMKFDYEFSKPKEGRYGKKLSTGKWDGLVGDLARGETDIVIAALMMTSEREEVIDFVAPYFDQSGILIMMRKPVRPTSLFKFMTVLRPEVWFSIVGALTVTGIMIWLLDKYSPYSARNNKEMYPYPCREFTLKESFWFALTSFTPQGGGEAPKALSGRTLVAAYWLFVVLMLATFTANLAAFLTVERMKSPVESLEQLARQSRINYTVVKDSDTHQFFKNMKQAEDTLYQKWKELTLNASSDQTQYRVWDYPIKEQYGHILLAIQQTGPVENETMGIKKVLEAELADFAFIHDAAAVKYQVYRNCNLTEVGEVFAERPYAVAVQQGSQLQEEISRKILDLQKDRYFETESTKYWNPAAVSKCPNTDDSEGITLGSLGGVFIATLFGLVLAMITLAGEIFYHKHKTGIDKKLENLLPGKKSKGVNQKSMKPELTDQGRITLGNQDFLKNYPTTTTHGGKTMPRVSYISVFPRNNRIYD